MVISPTACQDDDGGDEGAETSGVSASDSGTDATGSTGTPQPMNDAPTFQAQIDAAASCSAGASSLELRATRVGCVNPPPAPCTLPDPPRTDVGDPLACPSSDNAAALRLEVPQAGRYYIEVVTIAGDGSEAAECWSDNDDPEVIVIDAAFNTKPTIELMPLGMPCPAP